MNLGVPLPSVSLAEENPFKIFIRENQKDLVDSIVDVLEDRLRKRLSIETPKPLGLATGRTMEPIYLALVDRLKSWEAADLEKLLSGWLSFNLDEYVGLKDSDPHSFGSYMTHYLRSPLHLTSEQVRLPNGGNVDPYQEASSYRSQLQEFGGISLQLLGLGTNGHVGFNEPPCDLNASCRVVSLSTSTRQQNAFSFGGDLDLVPKNAITLGLKEILSAEEIHLIVIGISKAQILDRVLTSPPSVGLPASWLKSHKRVFLWVDKAALTAKN